MYFESLTLEPETGADGSGDWTGGAAPAKNQSTRKAFSGCEDFPQTGSLSPTKHTPDLQRRSQPSRWRKISGDKIQGFIELRRSIGSTPSVSPKC
jgi:hypothetical protein